MYSTLNGLRITRPKEQPKNMQEDVIKKVRNWLKADGIAFFKEIKETHGTLNAVWNEGRIPHSVHLREGMQVRNFLRTLPECKDWDAHDFDNKWMGIIEKAIAD